MRILINAIIGINILSFSSVIFLISKSDLVYIRQLLTGKFISDTLNIDLKESTLNNKIDDLFTYGDKTLIKNLFDQNKKNKLNLIKKSSNSINCRVPTEHPQTNLTKTDCLARLIAFEVSPYFTGKKCGLSGSISQKIKNVSNGIGCCSDFNQSFMLYAGYVGLKVREVSNINHTAAEYFDPYSNEWKWIDTSYRMQISNDDGQILSAFKIYKKDVGEALHVINTFPIFKEKKRVPYNRIADKGEISYTLYDDIIEKEKLKNRLVKIGVPELIANFIQLNSQNLFRPKYLVLGGGLRSVGMNANLLQKILFINILNSLFTLISLLLLFKVKKS